MFVDAEGRRTDEDGEGLVDFAPFLSGVVVGSKKFGVETVAVADEENDVLGGSLTVFLRVRDSCERNARADR